MLELVALSCTVMSQRKYTDSSAPGDSGERSKSRNRIHKSSHHDAREHKYGRNSSEDPGISSSKSDKHVSTNARTHPRAELKATDHSHSYRSKHASSNHVHNHISPKSHDLSDKSHSESTTPNRKRSHDSVDDDVWTEHTSSSGRTYYYNKRLDKSQWEKPKSLAVKKAKTDTTPDSSSTYSSRKTASTPATTSSSSSSKHSSHSHSHSSHHHKDYGRSSSHRSQYRGGSHTHHSHDRKERYESSHHSSSRRGSGSRSHSRSSSPVGGGKSDRGRYSRGHSRSSGHERGKEKESSGRHSKSEHTTPSSRGVTTVSPCTPVLTSSTVAQATLVSPSTPHSSSMPLTSYTNTTPVNSGGGGVAILSTPQGTFVQTVDQAMSASQQQTRHKLSYTQQQQASNGLYVQDTNMGGVGGVAVGFVGVGGSNLSSPQTVTMSGLDAAGLHPLQKALLIQNQVQQNFGVVESNLSGVVAPVAQAFAHHMTQQQSLPGSPLLQSPIPIPQHGTGTQIIYGTPTAIQATQPLTQVQPGLYTVASAAPHATFDPSLSVSGNFVSINSTVLRTPMSSLSCQIASDAKFPDPSHLESAPASKVNMELFHRGLTEPWNQYNNQIQQQIESCQLDSLQRRSTDKIVLSSKLARSWLRLETSQISVASKDNRLSGLRGLLEDISKT